MVYRHAHGHGHHLHWRRSTIEDREAAQLDGLDVGAHVLFEPVHDVPQLVPRLEANPDEKPAGADSNTTTIVISVVLPLLAAVIGLAWFARKGVVRRRREEQTNKFKSMDFGLQDGMPTKGGKRKSAFFSKEKEGMHKAQLSMDMNLSSPYLLPPNMQNSRESFNSLAKTLQSDDPYRSVADYANSDAASMRSFKRGPAARTSSIHTSKMPTSPLQSPLPVAQPMTFPQGNKVEAHPAPAGNGFRFVDDGPGVTQVPEIQEPAAVANPATRKLTPNNSRPSSMEPKEGPQPMVAEIVNGRESMLHSGPNSPVMPDALGIMNRPPRKESMPVINAPGIEAYESHAIKMEFEESGPTLQRDEDELHMSVQPEQVHPRSAGLGVPGQDSRRLSVGLRPLPPDEFLESEDPEFRANRIRSFYKEYFEDTKADQNRPPVPQLPQQRQPQQQAAYYEDYDGNFGETAYFDPETNAFVMPYAQPVTRRAMTPPPNNRRPMPGPGQRGPPGPRGPHGGPPMHAGPHARPRAGSVVSGRGWGPRSPRPGSSASNPRFNGQPKKPMPPPAALNSLPTPSKLKDDSSFLTGAIDFAPPPTFKEQAGGRSQSPLGERIPYKAHVPAQSPLVSAFDDTPALPSPHLLRKSGTYTALDFAPPRRFRDPETMSETGSVHSMHSGISGAGLNAVRAGAGRVSRLPTDTVFTQAALNDTLKPNWDMHR